MKETGIEKLNTKMKRKIKTLKQQMKRQMKELANTMKSSTDSLCSRLQPLQNLKDCMLARPSGGTCHRSRSTKWLVCWKYPQMLLRALTMLLERCLASLSPTCWKMQKRKKLPYRKFQCFVIGQTLRSHVLARREWLLTYQKEGSTSLLGIVWGQ